MGDTNRKTIDAIERKQRMAKSGRLPRNGGSRRSDRIRAIADDLFDEFGADDELEFADDSVIDLVDGVL